jgi:hypothetical protein
MAAFLLQAFCDQINHSLFVFRIREKNPPFFPTNLVASDILTLLAVLLAPRR